MKVLAETLRFRPMRRSDLEAVARLEQAAHPFPWSREQILDSLRAGHAMWLCCQEQSGGEKAEVLGYGVLSWVLDEASLLTLAVAPRRQGRGIGRALLNFLLAQAREQDMTRVFLEVRESNSRAILLYESSGFALVGRRRGYYPGERGREDALLYAWNCRPA